MLWSKQDIRLFRWMYGLMEKVRVKWRALLILLLPSRSYWQGVEIHKAVIGHSLGAASISLAVHDGLQIPKFIAMGAPTIGDDILDSFRAIIHAPSYINQGIKDACLKMYGREFDELTMTHTIKAVKCPILAIHGEDDFDVRIFHLDALIKAKPDIETLRVKGLGHRRILKDKKTIDRIIEFIGAS